MSQEFYWTARFFGGGQEIQSKYFATQTERDAFVLAHEGWKKRGKICVENLERHLEDESAIQEGNV